MSYSWLYQIRWCVAGRPSASNQTNLKNCSGDEEVELFRKAVGRVKLDQHLTTAYKIKKCVDQKTTKHGKMSKNKIACHGSRSQSC